MSQSARVESTQALENLKDALARFGVAAQAALGSAATEIERTLSWLHEQGKFWRVEVDRRREAFNRAKAELTARRWSTDKGRSRGATEQELEYEKARQRLAEAEAKVEAVRRWQRLLPEAIKEYEGPSRQLSGMVESDLRHSLAILDSKIGILEEYAADSPFSREPLASAPVSDALARGSRLTEEASSASAPDTGPPLDETEGRPA